MRAMAKEPDRRYPTSAALAADIARHLSGLPVDAGPSSTLYRMQKFVRRHRGKVAAAAVVLPANAASQ